MNNRALEDLLQPVVEDLGFELLGVEYAPHPTNGLLRLYIDSDAGITVDDCAIVSREVSGLLDVEDPISGHYNLEVSSPGMNRPLFKLEHFRQFIGEQAKLTALPPVDGRKNFKGTIQAVEGEDLLLEVDGEIYRIPHDRVQKARLVPEFD